MNYLLDTNLVLIYLRDNLIARNIEENLNLLSGQHNLIISVVTVGELRSIAIQNKWGNRRKEELEETLADFLIADINTESIIKIYAEIDAFSQGKLEGKKSNFSSRNMGKNDLWIASTALVLNAELLTTDKDFSHLKGTYLNLKIINLDDYK